MYYMYIYIYVYTYKMYMIFPYIRWFSDFHGFPRQATCAALARPKSGKLPAAPGSGIIREVGCKKAVCLART